MGEFPGIIHPVPIGIDEGRIGGTGPVKGIRASGDFGPGGETVPVRVGVLGVGQPGAGGKRLPGVVAGEIHGQMSGGGRTGVLHGSLEEDGATARQGGRGGSVRAGRS